MLTIVIPMAGRGQRFASEGYAEPKPLIRVHGTPMIETVVANVRPAGAHRFVFVCQREHARRFSLAASLAASAPGCALVELDGVTGGAACTVLLARDHLRRDEPLMIANSDQWIDHSIDRYLDAAGAPGLDGLIMTMRATDTKWSFVALDAQGHVTRVAEKEPISDEATVGVYNFTRAGDFLDAADEMIRREDRVNGEFYVAPVYNYMIERGRRIGVYNVGAVGAGVHGLGVPSDLRAFETSSVSRRAARAGWKGR